MRVFGCLLLALLVPCANLAAATGTGTLRVGVWTLWHDREVTVSAGEAGARLGLCSGCPGTKLAGAVTVRARDGGLVLGDGRPAAAISLTGGVVLAAHGERITLNSPVRISARNGELVMAATLPVESYVERVVASESGAEDSDGSLQALAIVARSFALHVRHGHGEYDVCDSTHCQLLHWAGSAMGQGRWAAAHRAALATAGETLWFGGRRAEAWFHQNCGGRTAAPDEVWPGAKSMPWLVSRADPYCTAGGAREWTANFSLDELTRALASAGLARPGWKTLAVVKRGGSGRATELRAGDATVEAEDFRLAVGRMFGWGRILSNWYEVAAEGGQFVFHGRGSGHGVGLCQAGAAAMAAQGRDAAQILGQYFPGAAVADEATGQQWQRLRGQGFELEALMAADAGLLPEVGRAFEEAEQRSGLRGTGTVTVRAFGTVEGFREATLAPGWVAAFTEGDWIGTQPLATLKARGLLAGVLRHEFLHALVEAQAGTAAPLWLREGLVEFWADGTVGGLRGIPDVRPEMLDAMLAHAGSEAESQKAHRAAGWYAQRLLELYGRGQVLGWLRTGVPANVTSGLG